MHSWNDTTLTALNSWMVWAGIGTTLLGLMATTFGFLVSNELARRDEIRDEQREELLKQAIEDSRKAEMATRPKPLAQRLRDLINRIDPLVIPQIAGLKEGQSGIANLDVPESAAAELRALCLEDGASRYVLFESSGDVRIKSGTDQTGTTIGGNFIDVKLTIFPALAAP